MIFEHWSPKIISYIDNPNHKKLEKNLIKFCLDYQNKTKQNQGNWISKETYNTLNKFNLHEDKKFKILFDWVSNNVSEYAKKLNYESKFNCVESWFNIYNKYDYQEFHTHSTHTLSAVYFLKSNPKKSAKIFFKVKEDQTFNDLIVKSFDRFNSSTVSYEAVPGRLLIFKSNLPHCVERSEEDNTRISLAFNFSNK